MFNIAGALAMTVPLIGIAKYSLDSHNVHRIIRDKDFADKTKPSEKSDVSLYLPESSAVPFTFAGKDVIEDYPGSHTGDPKIMNMQATQVIYGIIIGESGAHAYANGHTSKSSPNAHWDGWDYSKAKGLLYPGSMLALEALLHHNGDHKPLDTEGYGSLYKEAFSKNPLQGLPSQFVNWVNTGTPVKQDNVMTAVRSVIAAAIFSSGFNGSPGLAIRQAMRMARADGSPYEAVKGSAVATGCVWLAMTGASKSVIRRYAEQYYDLNEAVTAMDEDPQTCRYAVPYAISKFCNQKCIEDTIYEIASDGGAAYAGAAAIAGAIACVNEGLTKEDRSWVKSFIPEKYAGVLV